MIHLPTITEHGFKQCDGTVHALTFQQTWDQFKLYQPGYVTFLRGYWKEAKTSKKEKKAHVVLLWHVLTTLDGEFLSLNESFFNKWGSLVENGVLGNIAVSSETNVAIAANKDKFRTGQILIDMIGEEDALPVIQLCGESLDPAIGMVIALYMTTLLMGKMNDKRTAVHPN